jgi:Ca-activated chloride channel homolog
MTPFTSFLVLESAAAYGRFGIQRRPRDPLWGAVPHAALELPAVLGLGLFGCSRKDESPARSEPSTIAEREVTRAKASGSYGLRDPSSSKSTASGRSAGKLDRRGTIGGPGGGASRNLAEAPRARPRPRRRSSRRPPRHRGGDSPAKRPADLDGDVKQSDTSVGAEDKEEERAQRIVVLRVCSDAARRSLAHRRAIWRQRLDRYRNVLNWIRVYRKAGTSCELPHWRDRRGLLDLIQRRVSSPAEVRHLLAAVRDRKGRGFIRRRLLRRAVTSEMNAALAGSDSVNWALVEGTLAKPDEPQKRLTQLRALCREHPGSRGCLWRLIRTLVAAARSTEALTVALKMRTDGLATPELMQQIGDLLAAASRPQRAMRVYSEIVEFSPEDPAARLLLGDIYLRHGWYEPAYRQYRTLTQRQPDDPMALMRLAAAAAGTGRVDEALRLERKVAGGQGEPGPKDPRRWARLWSAARIARLMLESATTKGKESLRQSMERSLRRLQVLTQPGVLVLVTWEDLNAPLTAQLKAGDKPLPWAERIDASPTGLVAFTTTARQLPALTAEITRAETPDRKVSYQLTVVRWDGKQMRVANTPGELTDAKPMKTAVKIP